MAEAIHAARLPTGPTLTYVDGQALPSVVASVMKDIQKLMMDDVTTHDNRPGTIPNMPREFICSGVVDEDQKIMKIAGEDERLSKFPKCYQIIVPFLTSRPPKTLERSMLPHYKLWCGNVISIDVSGVGLVVINIKGVVAREKKVSAGRTFQKYFPISTTNVKDIPSKSLKDFLQSPLVCKQTSGSFVVSSHKMTITWLRSRLDKALNKHREVKKNVEVIATIKQKDGGPLFLQLNVEEKNRRSGKITSHNYLFLFCPAFRVSRCQLIVPVFSLLDSDILSSSVSSKHYLWKIITKCDDTSSKHKHKSAKFLSVFNHSPLSRTGREENVKSIKQDSDDKASYKASIDKSREITPQQRRKCEQCLNPASQMLLKYYYQYSHIPEEEMNQATSFVWKILNFLKECIEEDEEHNDPKILEFVESGSVPEKLKVIQPDEFDVMINIDLPDSTDCYTFLEDDTFPTGYAICKVRRSNSFSRGLKRCFRKSEEFSHCLAPEQLAFGWLYSKLELAINKYEKSPQRQAELKVRRSGPAMLLEIIPSTSSMKKKLPRKISVDLVLALRFGKGDSRFAVAKRAKEEQFYKKVVKEQETPGEDGQPRTPTTDSSAEKGVARKNLKYLWRISYSAQERRYLEYVREIQQANGVEGCQDICLMILKTICTREILKREESVICHKLSTYILKTALFHVLAESDLIHDWKMDCLADRYVDLLDKLSKWQKLDHFFFDNASHLKEVFPKEDWCEKNTTPKNLFDELHATLKIQLLYRFSHIAESFKERKQRLERRIDGISRPRLKAVLVSGAFENVIHPPFDKSVKSADEESRRSLVDEVSKDRKVGKAAKAERKGGPHSDQDRNLERPEEDEKKSQDRHQLMAEKRANRGDNGFLVDYDPYEGLDGVLDDDYDTGLCFDGYDDYDTGLCFDGYDDYDIGLCCDDDYDDFSGYD